MLCVVVVWWFAAHVGVVAWVVSVRAAAGVVEWVSST